MSSQQSDSKDSGLGRRRAINIMLGGSFVGWLGVALYPVLKYLKPLTETRSPDEVELTPKELKKLDDMGFVIIRFGEARVIVMRDPTGRLRATSAKCTHEGCTVQYKNAERLIWCACHNAKFELSGRVISGPAPRALKRYQVSGSKSGKRVVVTKGS